MNKLNKLGYVVLIGCLSFAFVACDDDSDKHTLLKNDCLKWTAGPNIAGLDIEFAYAMALPYNTGKIVSAQAEASIAGADGTWMEHNSYYTTASGQMDIPVLVGNPSATNGKTTTVDFVVDTCAATLRYYYKIPEAAKGQSVSFTFSTTASTGEKVSYNMGPYTISKMDMALDLSLSRANCYISIEDMAVYNAQQAAEIPEKIDLVYNFLNLSSTGIEFGHAFAAPAAGPDFLPTGFPENLHKNAKIRKGSVMDAHLARLHLSGKLQPEVYVDDIDLQTIDLANMPNYALNIITDGGLWVETQDGKYRAFIYANNMRTIVGGTISMKRYTMK
ncbi:MAG: DUF4466 family protein [Dysgonamonadaceae bacterium]|nr:DUF4466 family protein [Dysgonamonadaceae bacterium]